MSTLARRLARRGEIERARTIVTEEAGAHTTWFTDEMTGNMTYAQRIEAYADANISIRGPTVNYGEAPHYDQRDSRDRDMHRRHDKEREMYRLALLAAGLEVTTVMYLAHPWLIRGWINHCMITAGPLFTDSQLTVMGDSVWRVAPAPRHQQEIAARRLFEWMEEQGTGSESTGAAEEAIGVHSWGAPNPPHLADIRRLFRNPQGRGSHPVVVEDLRRVLASRRETAREEGIDLPAMDIPADEAAVVSTIEEHAPHWIDVPERDEVMRHVTDIMNAPTSRPGVVTRSRREQTERGRPIFTRGQLRAALAEVKAKLDKQPPPPGVDERKYTEEQMIKKVTAALVRRAEFVARQGPRFTAAQMKAHADRLLSQQALKLSAKKEKKSPVPDSG
ncbi:MAG TPA: hypothetical protein EYP93_07340, partial [Gammaproteobacteria bacterium]|nr:hypothetical protein [Gammaproteobacteria bacterium]